VAEDAHERRIGVDPHQVLEVPLDPCRHLVVAQLDILGETGPAHHAAQEHLPLRRTVLEHAGVPQGAQDAAPLFPGDQVAEAVQGMGDAVALVAETDHGHGGIGDLAQHAGNPRIQAREHIGRGKGGSGDDDHVRLPLAAIGAAHPVGAALSLLHRRHRTGGLDHILQGCGQGVGQILNALAKRGQDATRPGGAGDGLARGPLLFFLLGQHDHGPDQPAVLPFQFGNAREAGDERHGLRVAGKNTGHHGGDQLVQRLLAQSAAAECRQGLIHPLGGLGDERRRLQGQTQLAGPGDQAAFQEGRAVFRHAVQLPAGVDKALAGVVVAPVQMAVHPDGRAQLQGLWLAVEKTVGTPFARIAVGLDAQDLAADPIFLLQQGQLNVHPGLARLVPQQPGRRQTGNPAAHHDYFFHPCPLLTAKSQ